MYNLLANENAASLRTFFLNTLPTLAGDWWPRHVVNALTFQQQRRALESRIEGLAVQFVPSPNTYIQEAMA